MKENIALIREVHHKLPRIQAENEAIEALKKISFDHLAHKRKNMCSKLEQLYVMIIRTLFSDMRTILIKTPFAMVDSLTDIGEVVKNIEILNQDKGIIILDTMTNFSHYKDSGCNIIK